MIGQWWWQDKINEIISQKITTNRETISTISQFRLTTGCILFCFCIWFEWLQSNSNKSIWWKRREPTTKHTYTSTTCFDFSLFQDISFRSYHHLQPPRRQSMMIRSDKKYIFELNFSIRPIQSFFRKDSVNQNNSNFIHLDDLNHVWLLRLSILILINKCCLFDWYPM